MAGGKLPRRGSRKDLLRQAEGTVSETITSTDALTRLREALPRQPDDSHRDRVRVRILASTAPVRVAVPVSVRIYRRPI